MLNAKGITDLLTKQRARHVSRDQRWDSVRSARSGDLHDIAPDMFSDEIRRPIVANFIDTVARDLAEMEAPLPSFSCSSATMASDRARKFADKRTKIVQNYMSGSNLARQMYEGADHFNTYAVSVFYIEPDFETKMPRVCVEDPTGGYADFDRWGRLRSYLKVFCHDAHALASMFYEYSDLILGARRDMFSGGKDMVEVVRYCDAEQIALVLLAKEPILLVNTPNPLKEVPVRLAMRPWLHSQDYKGQFDDAVWIQIARDCLARLNLEAVEKSVQAPLAIGTDVQEIAFGPDALIRTATPEKVRRVGLELPQGAFAESQLLMEEMRTGTRYPAARSGQMDANIVTGRGVMALMGGFETQVRAAQLAFKDALTDVVRLMFKMDQTYWPNVSKSIRGTVQGTPYEVEYKPSRDIDSDFTCEVEYGWASGMDPNRAVVMLLQLRGDKLISRDYFQRQLPFDLNVTEEQSKTDVEELRDAIKQGIYAYAQSIPALAQQGLDPSEPVAKAAQLVKGLQEGKSIEDMVMQVFVPQAPPAGMPAPGGPEGMAGSGPGGGPGGPGGTGGGLTESGRLTGVPPGQAGQAPGGRPDLGVMLAGLSASGAPQMSAYTMRRRRI